jgi:hypothetical protein
MYSLYISQKTQPMSNTNKCINPVQPFSAAKKKSLTAWLPLKAISNSILRLYGSATETAPSCRAQYEGEFGLRLKLVFIRFFQKQLILLCGGVRQEGRENGGL